MNKIESINDYIKLECLSNNIIYEKLMAWCKVREYIEVKSKIIYELKETGLTYQYIWNIFKTNHSSILYLYKKFNKTTKIVEKKIYEKKDFSYLNKMKWIS